jgi:hypothetical protein
MRRSITRRNICELRPVFALPWHDEPTEEMDAAFDTRQKKLMKKRSDAGLCDIRTCRPVCCALAFSHRAALLPRAINVALLAI